MNGYTSAVIFCLAILTGVLNYYGLAQFVAPGEWFPLILCAMTGFGVTLAISLFWNKAYHIIPNLMTSSRRAGGWLTIIVGICLILAVSTYWNLIAISGAEIARLSSMDVVVRAEAALAEAINASSLYQTFLPDIAAFNSDVAAIVDAEINGGGTSGDPTPGPISNTMAQVANRLNNLTIALHGSGVTLAGLRAQGDVCLEALQVASNSGDTSQIATQVTCINGIIGDLSGQNVISAIDRGMRTLTDGIVLPAAVKTEFQRTVIAGFMADQQQRADGIAALLASVEVPIIAPISSEMSNQMIGVLLHWKSIIPAIATAVAIDLLPAVILILGTLYSDDKRVRGQPSGHWTADELTDALRQMQILSHFSETPKLPMTDLPPPFVDLPDEDWDDLEEPSNDITDGAEK